MCIVALASTAHAQLATNTIYVGNQGNFSDANGTVSIYTPATTNVVTDGLPNLSTLVQSIFLHDGLGYVMANTSDRIDIFDLNTNMRTGQITDVASPRYMAVVAENKAYVSNLFSNSVTIVNLDTGSAGASIAAGSNPEDIALIDAYAYVANNGFGFDSTLTKIDVASDVVADTLYLGCDGPRALEVDGQNELWVFCNGKTVYNADFTEIIEQTNGQVLIVNNDEVFHRFELDAQMGASSAGQDTFYDPVSDRIFAVQDSSILVFDTTTNSQLDSIAISGDESIGGVAYDAAANVLMLARITGFTTAGFVSMHAIDGTETGRFDAGIAPTSIVLWQTGTSVSTETEELPAGYALHQNYPNPFNPTTTFSFELPASGAVSIKIFDVLGKEKATAVQGVFQQGLHEISWEATNLSSGVYYYQIIAPGFTASRQMTLLK